MTVQHRLNEYHLQFLRSMVRGGVRFLVIGGQARFVHHGTITRDLDLWVDISAQNRPQLVRCLMAWKAEYPVHYFADISALRPGFQIKIPDADVCFMGRDNRPAELLVADGIDILTSIGDADFNEYYDRAVLKSIDGQDVPFLSSDDLDAISPASGPR
jgi:hypothetical protein